MESISPKPTLPTLPPSKTKTLPHQNQPFLPRKDETERESPGEMKLRIRSVESKETLKIETPTPCSFQSLKDAIADKISASQTLVQVHVSLNRKDELIASPDQPLHSLGITSGDLIFYTLNPYAFSPPPPPSLPLVSQSQDLNQNPHKTPDTNPTASHQSITETPTLNLTPKDKEEEEQNMDIDQEFFENPFGIDEVSFRFPSVLRKVYKQVQEDEEEEDDFKFLLVALHALLLDSGFGGFDSVQQRGITGFRLPSSNLTMQYTIPGLLSNNSKGIELETVCLKFQNLGGFFNVYGSLNKNSLQLYRLCLDKSRFVSSISFACKSNGKDGSSISFHVKEFFEFWKIVKDGLALPLLIDLCEVTGFALPPCFTRLPTELKLKILELLPGVDLGSVSCVSSELRYLSSSNDLWKQKVMEEFALSGEIQTDNWKREYVGCLIMRRSRPRVRHQPLRGRFPNQYGFGGYRRGRAPDGFPGMLGGDYDRFPAPFGSNQGFRFPARRNSATNCDFAGFDA